MKSFVQMIMMLAAAAAVLHACKDDPKSDPLRPSIVLRGPSLVELGAGEEECRIAYGIEDAAADSRVSAATAADWIHVEAAMQGFVDLKIDANTLAVQRTGDVVLSFAGAESVKVTLCQAAFVPRPEIRVSSSVPLVVADTDTSAAIEYELADAGNPQAAVGASSSAEWLRVGDIDASVVCLIIDPNDGDQREAAVTLSYAGADDVDVTVRQLGYRPVPEIVVEGQTVVEADVRETEYVISYDVRNADPADVRAVSSVNWLTVTSHENLQFVLTVLANYDQEAREGEVRLSLAGAEDVAILFRQAARPKPVIEIDADSRIIVADPDGSDARDESDLLTVFYRIVDPIETMKISAATDADWIELVEVLPGFTDFRVKGNDTDVEREASITFSYMCADDVSVLVRQGVRSDPVITITSDNPVEVGRRGSEAVWARYTIDGLHGGETPEATSDVDWIRMTVVSTGYMGFKVDANVGEVREGRIRVGYRNAEPAYLTVRQKSMPAGGGDGLSVSVAEVTSFSARVDVVTYIDETYTTGVVPKSEFDKFASDRAFIDALVYEMRREYDGIMPGMFTFASYFGLVDDDSSTQFGADLQSDKLLAATEYYAFAFDLSADADDNVTYSGTLYKTAFETLPKESVENLSFEFAFEGSQTSPKLRCTASDPSCECLLVVLPKSYIRNSTPEQIIAQYHDMAGDVFTGTVVTSQYLSKYSSPYVAYACGYDSAAGDITSDVTVYEFAYPPASASSASSASIRRAR